MRGDFFFLQRGEADEKEDKKKIRDPSAETLV